MSGNTLLVAFLLLQVFIMGVIAALAFRHGYIHFGQPAETKRPSNAVEPKELITPAVRERLLRESQDYYEAALQRSASKLQQDLGVSAGHINNLVMRLASEIVAGEMEKYRNQLSRLHGQADDEMAGISKEIARHEEEIRAKITQELEVEKQRLIQQIDTKLGDAMASFLVEALKHNIDLGNQTSYLISLLDEHKEEFKKEVKNGS